MTLKKGTILIGGLAALLYLNWQIVDEDKSKKQPTEKELAALHAGN